MQITDLAMNIVKLNRGDKLDDEVVEQTITDLKFLALVAGTDETREHYEQLATAIEARDWDTLHKINQSVVDEFVGDPDNCEDIIYNTAFEEAAKYLGDPKAVVDLVDQAFFFNNQLLFYFDSDNGVGVFYHFDSDDEGTIFIMKVERGREPNSFTADEIEANRKAMNAWWNIHKDTITHIVMLVYSPDNIHVKGGLSSIIRRR